MITAYQIVTNSCHESLALEVNDEYCDVHNEDTTHATRRQGDE